MYCIKCGNELPDNSKFCDSCGTLQEKGSSKQDTEPKSDIQQLISQKRETSSLRTWMLVIFAIVPLLTFVFLFVVIISNFNIIPKIINLLFGLAWFVSCVLLRKDLKQKIGTKSKSKWFFNNVWSAFGGIVVVGCVLAAFVATPALEEPTDKKINTATTAAMTETVTEIEPESTTKPFIEMSASKLIKAYQENEINASKNYKDKYLKVTGYVNQVSRSDNLFLEDGYFIYIDYGNPYDFNTICCLLNEESIEAASEFKPGDKITIIGRCEGFETIHINMHDCDIVT